ncbi:winged helix-turn-helix domain-containing protein [Rheinheimera aquimaris]|uniref:winged helix-turn-helix domain-containing protein n=1 Tax=Rheinheimera aquimaris TaxID=412437 RepID=UPI0010669620|nr:winged helix-turn-helix domain-containing protein [Rheinheimera aquimaris]
MAIKLDKPLQVGDWQYVPEQDKLVQLAADGKIAVTADLDNLSQKVANYFIANAGKLITKDELLHDVWGIRDVSDGRVTRVIRVLRVALGDDTREPRYIETIPKRGYRFIAPVTVLEPQVTFDKNDPPAQMGINRSEKEKAHWPWYLGFAFIFIAAITWWLWPATPDLQDKTASDIPMLRYKPVTALDGLEFYHNVSEDERYLVYSYASPEQENVTVLMLEDLQEHRRIQITDSSYSSFGAAFSPDESQLAYHRAYPDGKCEIRVADFNGDSFTITNDKLLVSCGDNSISSRLSWSPDSAYLVYPTMSDKRQTILMLKRVSGGAAEELTTPPPTSFGDYVARFSNQGNKLVFLREAAGSAQIWVLDLSSRETSMLVKVTDVLPGNIDWTNDDRYIIYPSAPNTISQVEVRTGNIRVLAYTDVNAHEIQVAKSNTVYASVGNFSHVNIKKVANQITNPVSDSTTVFSSNRNETLAEANPLPKGPTAVVSRRSGLPQVWLFYPGGEQKQITFFEKNERFRSLVFSPSGKELLAQINNEIWLLSDSKAPVRLSENNDNLISQPAWSYDGKRIYYAESKSGRWHIVSHEVSDNLLTPIVFAVDRELYIESYDGKYSIWRDAISKKFYMQRFDTQIPQEIPITLPENQAWLKFQTTKSGVYFAYLVDEIKYSLKYYSFDNGEISNAVTVDYLYHSRFSLTPDEKFIYILEAVRGDFDVASVKLP